MGSWFADRVLPTLLGTIPYITLTTLTIWLSHRKIKAHVDKTVTGTTAAQTGQLTANLKATTTAQTAELVKDLTPPVPGQ